MYVDDKRNPTSCFQYKFCVAMHGGEVDFITGSSLEILHQVQRFLIIQSWSKLNQAVLVLPRKPVRPFLAIDLRFAVHVTREMVELINGKCYPLYNNELDNIHNGIYQINLAYGRAI